MIEMLSLRHAEDVGSMKPFVLRRSDSILVADTSKEVKLKQ